MSYWTRVLCILGLLPLTALGQYARDYEYDDEQYPHQLRAGIDIFHRDVTANRAAPSPLLPIGDEDGNSIGGLIGYDHVSGDRIYFGADWSRSEGDATSPTTDTDNTISTFEFRLGHTFIMDETDRTLMSVFAGYGVTTWERTFQQDAAPDEDYEWKYVSFGLRTDRAMYEDISIGFNAKIMVMIDGEIEAKLSQADPTVRNVNVDLGDRIQVLLEIPVTYRFQTDAPVSLRLVPYYMNTSFDGGNSAPITKTDGSSAGTYTVDNTDIHIFGGRFELVRAF